LPSYLRTMKLRSAMTGYPRRFKLTQISAIEGETSRWLVIMFPFYSAQDSQGSELSIGRNPLVTTNRAEVYTSRSSGRLLTLPDFG
jgi:hypothetical protein